MSESSLGYGQLQVTDDRIISMNGQYCTSIRGNISTVPLADVDEKIKMPRADADFMFKIEGETRTVYVKGCEVRAVTLFDEDDEIEAIGDTWVVE